MAPQRGRGGDGAIKPCLHRKEATMSKSFKEATVVKLTDTQLLALSGATHRDDGVIVMPDRVQGQAAKKLANALVEKGLAREVRAKSGMPITRRDEDSRRRCHVRDFYLSIANCVENRLERNQ
jgi:hypothetical protein